MVAERIQVALCLRPLSTEKSLYSTSLSNVAENDGCEGDASASTAASVFTVDGTMVTINPLVLALADDEVGDIASSTPRKRRKFSYKTPTRPKQRRFTYDSVYAEGAKDHASVYEDLVGPLVQTVLSGRNASVLAYGSTGSGKTHTIFGGTNVAAKESGVVFRAANALFHAIEEDKKAEIRLTFVELYNDSFIDLLGKDDGGSVAPSSSSRRLRHTPSRRTPSMRRYSSVSASASDEKIIMRQDKRRNVFLMGSDSLRTRVKSAEGCPRIHTPGMQAAPNGVDAPERSLVALAQHHHVRGEESKQGVQATHCRSCRIRETLDDGRSSRSHRTC